MVHAAVIRAPTNSALKSAELWLQILHSTPLSRTAESPPSSPLLIRAPVLSWLAKPLPPIVEVVLSILVVYQGRSYGRDNHPGGGTSGRDSNEGCGRGGAFGPSPNLTLRYALHVFSSDITVIDQ